MRRSSRENMDIGPSGSELAGFLGKLQRTDEDALARSIKRVRQYYPRLRNLHVRRKRADSCEIEITERWGRKRSPSTRGR